MYREIKQCRCCQSSNLYKYLDLGLQPLANSYHKDPNEKLPEFPLEVMVCQNCWHSQLSVVVEPNLMFKNYLYVSGTSQTFHLHCEALANEAYAQYIKNNGCKDPIVLDIACNDGTLLSCFKNMECKVCGVDPAENLREFTKEKDIPVLVDYWGRNAVDNILDFLDLNFKTPKNQEEQITADIITATNVFAHVDDLDGFLDTCHKVLTPTRGILVIEFPYCEEMIQHVEFDTVYHEHLSYFTFNSFSSLISRNNFSIVKYTRTSIHGGSIRFFLKPLKYAFNISRTKTTDLTMAEKEKGLYNLETYDAFSEKVAKNKIDLNYLMDSLKNKTKVIGFAASAKGNTMLNHFKINLDYIVDENPLKFSYYTPGMNIPIYSTDVLKQEKDDLAIIVLAWNFYDEIREKIKKLRPKNRDTLIKYVPNVQEEEIMMRWD